MSMEPSTDLKPSCFRHCLPVSSSRIARVSTSKCQQPHNQVKLLFGCDKTWKKLLHATLFKAPEEDEEDKREATANLAEDQTCMAYFTFKRTSLKAFSLCREL